MERLKYDLQVHFGFSRGKSSHLQAKWSARWNYYPAKGRSVPKLIFRILYTALHCLKLDWSKDKIRIGGRTSGGEAQLYCIQQGRSHCPISLPP